MNEKIQAALSHIHQLFPDVTQVFFSENGSWLFCDENFVAPDFSKTATPVDIELLELAASAAYEDKGFPCAYRIQTNV